MTLEEMNHIADIMQSRDEIQNLIANYCFEHSCNIPMRFVANWADREDIRHEMPWGNTTGLETLEYNNPDGDTILHPFDASTMGKGALFIHFTDTPIIEIADDMKTAKAVFMSPGVEVAGERMGVWAYSKYGFEFVRENGKWKVWHMRVFPVFRNGYSDSFAEVAEEDLTKTHAQERFDSTNLFFSYTPQVIMPRNEPEPPLPYKTYKPGVNSNFSLGEEV
jgi:hypothetical protein